MGVTIHWKGSTKDKDIALKVIGYVSFMASTLNWKVVPYSEEGIVQVEKIVNESGEVVYIFPYFYGNEMIREMEMRGEKVKGTKSYIFGVIIDPPPPIHTESIAITFYKYKGRYEMRDFCKTQVFHNEETGNLVVHQILILMLMTIKNTWIPNLEIFDEGEFYKKWNYRILEDNHSVVAGLISDFIKAFKDLGYEVEGSADFDSGK
jgi:hypothetical protein